MPTTSVLFDPLFDAREFGAALGVTRQTIARWVNEGLIEPAKRVGPRGALVFTAAEVERAKSIPRRRKAKAA
jgi:DNA-binding transcriptional MerR regulator